MNNTIIPIAEKVGTDISSRDNAASLRADIEHLVEVQRVDVVTLDFVKVRTISESFADELFCVLLDEHSEHWFCEHLQVQNVGPYLRKTILDVIAKRSVPA